MKTISLYLRTSAVSLALSAVAGIGSLEAQAGLPVLTPGATVTGALEASDPGLNQRGRYRAYTFDARAGERFRFDLRSSDFDAYLSVARRAGELTDVLATNDDGGEGTDALLRFRAPADGRYWLIAQSLSTTGTGSYRLRFERLPEVPQAGPRAIAIGATATGTLGEESPLLEDDSRYDLYSFTGRAGQRVVITMRSEYFDAYLYLLSPGGEEVILARDDDSAGGLNARIRTTLPVNGEFRIRAASLGTEAAGRYDLELQENDRRATASRPIGLGRGESGELHDGDNQLDRGAHFHEWTYTARAGERLRISMQSGEVDAYLILGRMVNGAFETIAEDDDGGGGTDSLIETTLPAAGTYVIRALTFSPDETGAYTLRVDRL